MTAIARLAFDLGPLDARFWPAVAGELLAVWSRSGIAVRDAVLLLPNTALLGLAREAFARHGGWQPRIETPYTLAAALGPPPSSLAGAPTRERSLDRLAVAALLRQQPFGRDWSSRDPRAFEAAVTDVVATAHDLLDASLAVAPSGRLDWWQQARDALPPQQGPGSRERLLARVALEWAAGGSGDALARLWTLRASAWAGLQSGGAEPLIDALLTHAAAAGATVWRIETDTHFEAVAALPPPLLLRAHAFEDEAQTATLAVLQAIDAGAIPVALIAEDRLVVRRVRALLERARVALADETGWTLSTTRAAARLMTCLRAAAPDAGRDALLDALKAEQPDAPELLALETAWRRDRAPEARAAAFVTGARGRFAALRGNGPRRLGAWLEALRSATPRLLDALADDAAGRAVLAALHLDDSDDNAAWATMRDATQLDLAGFTTWVAESLEDATYLPSPPPSPQVVVTPMARAVLRPFGAVVFPGCDETHLGAAPSRSGLLGDATRRDIGLVDAEGRRRRERLAFAQLLRHPRLTLLHRTHDGTEPLATSPLVELALQARRRAGQAAGAEQTLPLPTRRVAAQPLNRPAPPMAEALPARLSASKAEALRACPYRFFARVGLGLSETHELDDDPDKRDHGNWLHAVLHAFHEARRAASSFDRQADRARLLEAAAAVSNEDGLDSAALLPYRAAFETFADEYLAWLHRHEDEGWQYAAGEAERAIAPPELGGVRLDGRIDRIDRHHESGAAMVIDYKTGSADALQRKVGEPFEDTQLAFYAALLTEEPHEPPPRAIYLALDERKPPKAIEHADPSASAAALVEGLAGDLEALRQGAGAAALGDGPTCEHCEMRGLCRRDHWTNDDPPGSGSAVPPRGAIAGGPPEPHLQRSQGSIR